MFERRCDRAVCWRNKGMPPRRGRQALQMTAQPTAIRMRMILTPRLFEFQMMWLSRQGATGR